MAEVPSGTVTFLFTDIEGSTARWERHPTAMRDALARHDALLSKGIVGHGGVVVTERGEGDSFFALFARPGDALAAACALQRALAEEPWPAEVAPLRVRMALHTGDAGMQTGWDYRGAAVNRCARLRGAAHGGQVLLSRATYALVHDLLPAGVGLRDLGDHRLKDLTHAEHIYQVVDSKAPGTFLPLKTLDAHRHTLPVQPTPFIGREREMAAVRARLLDPQTRLLTLTGPGGMGKTRLAVQVAAEVLDDFPDGVYFVALAALTDAALVLPTIARALGVGDVAEQSLIETLQDFLHDKRLLLVLDNVEQVADTAPDVAALLSVGAHVRALATSRAALHLRGERLHDVMPLTLPNAAHPLPPEALMQYEAVRLFIDRARDVQPAFAITLETAPAVAAICVRLDGLPLAIELAAARVRLFTPQALLSRLSNRLGVLVGGSLDLPARQRTLRAAIDWSYSLLTAEEQTLFARLGVFAGGRTLEAIEAVCNTDGTLEAVAQTESLLEKSLLVRAEADGETRFVMLETIHEYAQERLEARGETEILRRAHAAYFLALTEATMRQPDVSDAARKARLGPERDNLRAVLQWAQTSADGALGLRIGSALWRYWETHAQFSEGRRWLESLLVTAGDVAPPIRATAYSIVGDMAYLQSDYRQARASHTEALDLYRELGDRGGIAHALNNLGCIDEAQGDTEHARQRFEESLALHREQGVLEPIAQTLNNLGLLARGRGDYDRAAALYGESLMLYRSVEQAGGVALVLSNLGEIARDQGEYRRAGVLYAECLTVLQDRPQDVFIKALLGYTLQSIADVAHHEGEDAQALALYAEGLALLHSGGERRQMAYCLEGLARVVCTEGQPERAAQLWGMAAALRTASGAPLSPADLPAYERAVATMRSALGDAAFAAAVDSGQATPLERAIVNILSTWRMEEAIGDIVSAWQRRGARDGASVQPMKGGA